MDAENLELISDELSVAIKQIQEAFSHLCEGRPRTANILFFNARRSIRDVRQFVSAEIEYQADKRRKKDEPPEPGQCAG
jgi:hypothetical protein